MPPGPRPERSSASSENPSALRTWIDQRTGLDAVLEIALEEPIPGGARWAYVFGSGLLILFLSQILTGIALALFYVPAANDAHVTVAYIVKVVSGGLFLRSLHSYGASAIIVVLLLHIIQTFFYGAYKGRRELVWISGCGLFAFMLGMSFTGYLLPWDQKAYFATAVGTNVMGEMPGAGNFVKQLLRGGNQMGTITLSRFFVLHVFVLPGLLIALIATHIYLFRKTGPAGPIGEDPVNPQMPIEPFYPRQFGRDVIFGALLITAIAALSYLYPVQMGPQANPADTLFLPRPEWYFLPLFEWLKFWPGRSAVVGVVILPAIVTFLFVGVPFLDRGLERHPLRRPLSILGFSLVLAGMVGFGLLSTAQDRSDPLVKAQIARQQRAEQTFMKAPFAPLDLGNAASRQPAQASLAASASVGGDPSSAPGGKSGSEALTAAASAQDKDGSKTPPAKAPAKNPPPKAAAADAAAIAKGKDLFLNTYKCSDCHGEKGEGTEMGPKLIGIISKKSPDDIAAFLHKPSPLAQDAGMPVIDKDDEVKSLIAFVLSLK